MLQRFKFIFLKNSCILLINIARWSIKKPLYFIPITIEQKCRLDKQIDTYLWELDIDISTLSLSHTHKHTQGFSFSLTQGFFLSLPIPGSLLLFHISLFVSITQYFFLSFSIPLSKCFAFFLYLSNEYLSVDACEVGRAHTKMTPYLNFFLLIQNPNFNRFEQSDISHW